MAPKVSTAATRAALLEAAREEFAAYGVAGARVDRIAERAGVNKERIYGHFGSKEKLFDTVITEALDDLTAQIALPGADPVEYVAKLTDYYRSHPDTVRLLMWEALNYRGQELLEGQEARVERCGRKTASLAEGLGEPGPSAATARTLFMLTGLAMFPSMMPQLGRIILRDAADDHDAIRDQIAAFVAAALK
ncbi:TetR/AcrR family transcriptional regulator [Nonomuraea gerenzanensis]|uniref:Transcriptional regulator, TetR family n=1 Tax=Nonomuraea gerenzanensis TaxID=93944 RepID=A0A1M4E8F4_9ACTN|nr:TetR family transcriptional regulator [Nonomuraea gerenzanensis]UBU17398.1 TetR family transcriptional regulator [Nonomuraea gerenzanensis]SBO95151.1 Transcriptional regulator, TetR family [Nonomuraea gerenzanensis]